MTGFIMKEMKEQFSKETKTPDPSSRNPAPDGLPLVSVVIATKNEEAHIENCLRSIKDQSYPQDHMEIVVVDNASNDRTKEIALAYTERVFDKGPERSAQRNFGAEQSRGEYFIYLDADMVLSEELVGNCVDLVRGKPEVIALYIPEIVTGDVFFSRVRRFERSFYDGTVIDCARFIRRNIFLELGGFDLNLTGPEDWDLDKRLRKRGHIDLVQAPLYHNEADFDLGKYLSKKEYYSDDFGAYMNKWGKDDPDIQKQFGIWYRFFGVFLERGKWKKILAHPILALGMYFLRVLVGWRFLRKRFS